MIIEVGVTTKKNTIPITTGEIRIPNNNPILNHILFKGVKIFDFINPKIKKITEITNDQYLISLALNKGQIAMIKKTIENITPKLLLEPILILLFFKVYFFVFLRYHIIFIYTYNFDLFFLNNNCQSQDLSLVKDFILFFGEDNLSSYNFYH